MIDLDIDKSSHNKRMISVDQSPVQVCGAINHFICKTRNAE